MARTITADEFVEAWQRKQKGSSKTQKSVETPKISNADEFVAYWKEQKQAQNQQFAARARTARADKYENLVNSMRPEERVNLFTSNAGQYSGTREVLADLLSPERYSALEDRARNTYIPAQFWQKFADNERNQQYAQRYQNTYVPASLAQDAIHRSGTGNDFNAYSDAALRGEYLNKVDTGALQAELDALNAELSENKRYYDGAKRSLDSIARVKGKDDPTVQSYQKTVADYEEKQARAAQLQRDIHDSDAVKKYNAYESLRANADFAERSQAAGSKRVQFDLLDPSTWGVGDDKYDFVNDIDGYRNTVKFLSETQGAPTSYGLYSALSHITDDEKAMYNYLYATKGKEAAEEYLNYIEEGLNYRQGKVEADIVGDNLLKAAGYGIRTGAERFGTGIAGMFNDEAKAPAASEYGAQFVRENLADTGFKLPEWMGGASVGQTVFDLSNTAGNLAPSLLLSVLTAGAGAPAAVTGGVSSASMGLSAGGNAKAQALRDGYTPEQATRYGVLIGASEGALQYLLGGIGKLGGKLTGGVAKKAIQNIDDSLLRIAATGAIKMAGEGTEEYLQEILDPIYRNLLFNENNQINLTDPEAVYSFLLGALTAAVMDGSEIVKDGKARPSSLPNVNGALVAADAAQNVQSEQSATQNTAQETEQYVYTDETTGIPMVGTRPVLRMNAAADEIATTLNGATKYGYTVQEGANGGADLRARGKMTHLDAVEATAIAEAYAGGMDALEYAMAFHTVYEQAKQGKELSQIKRIGFPHDFAKPDISEAYSAGKLANQRAEALDPNSKFRAGVTVLPDTQLSKEQETQLDILDVLCRKYGVTAIADTALYLSGTDIPRSDVNAAYNGSTNRIHINLNAIGDAYLAVGVHELTHYVRANNAAGYSTLEGFVLDVLRDGGEDVDALIRYQMEQFGYSEELAREEVIANTIPAILNDEAYVKKLVETDRTLAERIRDFLHEFIDTIKETLRTLEGEASWKQMQSVRQDAETLSAIADMFDVALEGTQNAQVETSERGERFSIKYDVNNRPFVEVDEDILAGVPRKEWVNAVKENLRAKFPNGVAVGGNEININQTSRREMTFSKYMQWALKNDRAVYADKLRATNNADEIIRASRDYVNEALLHPRKDSIREFARGEVLLRVGNNDYAASVIVGTYESGHMLLYDVISLKPTSITERQNKKNTATKQRKGEVSRSAVFIDNIPQSDTTVKNSIRGGGTENSSEKINLSAQDTEAAPESNINAETPRPEELTGKRKAYKRRHERAFIENVAKALGIPGTAKGELRKMISELGDRVIAMGQLSEADKKAMFEKCYEAAREQDNSMVEQYSDLKNYLRSKPILSTNLTSEQRTQARGKLRVNGNGSPIGNVYDDLLAEFPGVFDDSITSPEDQFAAILSMYDSIQPREYTLDEFYGESAAAVKMEARANFEEELFQLRRKLNLAERAETVAHIRQQERLRTAAEAENIQVVDRALSEIKEKQKELERVTKNMVLTEGDRSIMDAVFNGGIQLEELKSRSNFYELKRYYEARAEVESRKRVIDQYNKKRRERLRNDAMNAIENSDRWKDKRIGALYERETQERNIRDITGNNQDAERIIAGYFQPIHDNEAKRTQYINDMNDRMLALKKDEKRKSVGLNKWESKATQLIGERIDYEERLAQLEKRGMGRSAEARMALAGLKLVDEEYSKLMKKHANKIDLKVCEAALPTVREIYDQVFQDMNDALVRNGYPKVEYRENYFPHFIGREYDSAGQKIAKAFGFNLTNMELPTDIVGLTSAFRPGKTWFANALERAGVKTEFDLYGGFDSYIRGATDVIFHTDDIQRLRALDNAIRYKYSDEGRRDRMRELMKNEDLTPDEREAQIHALYTDEKGKSMTTHLSGYVSNLTEYTNLLANKKSFYDRADEKRWGRTIYDVANWYQNRYAGNAIAGNLGVALSNFIPITQATSEVGTITLSQAMRDTAKAFAKDDGFSEQSAFLTNRRGTDRLASDLVANANNKLSIPFEAVDRFASETLVRAKYAQNLKSGMTAEAAMENADAWAAGLMADRSKGALPTIFGNKSPLTKAFTMFQVEVNNQLSYMFKDVPQDMKAKGVAAVAAALFKMFLAAWMYNELDEQITGRRRALDPLHMIAEAVGVDWKTENVIPRITGAKTVEEAPLFSYEPQTWAGAAESIGKNVVDQTPFFGSLLGGDGGRSPAAGATPDLWRIAKTLGNDEADSAYKKSVVWDELKKPLFYIVPPFAGGQVKKAIEGAKTVYEGGSYKKDKDGNDVLRFRTDQTGFDYAQAALFGPWALPEGRENIAKGFPILSAPDTAAYKNAIANGVDGAHFLLLLDEYKNLEPIKDADGDTEKNKNQQFREILFRDSSLTPEQKKMIDRDVIGQEKTADYTSKDRFIISTTPMEFIHLPKDDNAYERFTENVKNGMSEEDAALVEEWAQRLIDIETYTDEDGNEIEASQQKREMLFKDPNLTPEQKEMIDRQVIMGDGKKAKPADYSSSEAMMEASQLKGAHADKVKFFEAAGGTAEKYLSYYNLYSGLEPTKDINGEEIAGSREEALRNEIMNDDDMTPAQKRQLDEALTGGKTRNYISRFAFDLTKISKTAYKRGKAYVAAGISEAKAIQIEQWMSGRDYKKEDLRKYLVGLNLPESQIEAVLKARY